jgi:hypothetical protein
MNQQAMQYQQIIAKCWADEAFKQRLMADPAGTLQQEGVEIPPGFSIQVVENTDTSAYLVIPARPTDLPDEALTAVDGGVADFGGWLAGIVGGVAGSMTA